jgi:hypothetical protein
MIWQHADSDRLEWLALNAWARRASAPLPTLQNPRSSAILLRVINRTYRPSISRPLPPRADAAAQPTQSASQAVPNAALASSRLVATPPLAPRHYSITSSARGATPDVYLVGSVTEQTAISDKIRYVIDRRCVVSGRRRYDRHAMCDQESTRQDDKAASRLAPKGGDSRVDFYVAAVIGTTLVTGPPSQMRAYKPIRG